MRGSFATSWTLAACLVAGTALAAPPPPPPPSPAGGQTAKKRTGPPVPGADRNSATPRRRGPPPAPGQPSRPSAGGGAPAKTTQDPFIDQRTTTDDYSSTWGYSSGPAVTPNYTRDEFESELTINPVGYYQGVSVTNDNQPPFAPQALGTGASVLTWTGFERSEASSRVFFQLSSSVVHEFSQEGARIVIKLPNTSVNVRNNQRHLDTRFFRTPVTFVKVRRHGADTEIAIRLRRVAVPNVTLAPGANGYQMLVVEFPDGAPELDSAPEREARG